MTTFEPQPENPSYSQIDPETELIPTYEPQLENLSYSQSKFELYYASDIEDEEFQFGWSKKEDEENQLVYEED